MFRLKIAYSLDSVKYYNLFIIQYFVFTFLTCQGEITINNIGKLLKTNKDIKIRVLNVI